MAGRRMFLTAVAGLALAMRGSASSPSEASAKPASPATPKRAEELIQAEPPPFSEGIFPCSQCHTDKGNPTRRELLFHDEVQARFTHDAEHRWCLDCHDQANRDVLHLSSGEPVPFSESYRLCGQCHGDKFRDWRVGVHGKRIGSWSGAKTYFLCVNCHDPHAPRFKALKPEPPPQRPEEMRR